MIKKRGRHFKPVFIVRVLIEHVCRKGQWGTIHNRYGPSMLASSLHCVVSCIEVFCVLANDFSGLWSQLRSGLYSGYVSYLNFIGGNKSGLN